MPKLRIAVKGFLEQPLLRLVHGVVVAEAQLIFRRGSRKEHSTSRNGVLRVIISQRKDRIRAVYGRIRRFELLGEPCSQPDTADARVQRKIRPEGCLFEEP